jgi:hypothetical protein
MRPGEWAEREFIDAGILALDAAIAINVWSLPTMSACKTHLVDNVRSTNLESEY